MPRTPAIARIDASRCTGCGRCIAACPLPLIGFETRNWRKFAVLHTPQECTGCRLCERRCPVDAIAMVSAPLPMPAKGGVLNERAQSAWA